MLSLVIDFEGAFFEKNPIFKEVQYISRFFNNLIFFVFNNFAFRLNLLLMRSVINLKIHRLK